MPIYEFYCGKCHTVFNFLSKTVNTTKCPACPRCGRPKLDRQVSRFAISKGRQEKSQQDGELSDVDEARMEQVMEDMAREADGIDENNPQQLARMLRKLQQAGGLPVGERFEEALRRMEAGEDPEQLEAEMGDAFDDTDEPGEAPLRGWRRKLRPPQVDDTLYDM